MEKITIAFIGSALEYASYLKPIINFSYSNIQFILVNPSEIESIEKVKFLEFDAFLVAKNSDEKPYFNEVYKLVKVRIK